MEEELLGSEYDVTSYHTNRDYYDHQPSGGVLSSEGNQLGYNGDHHNYGYSGYA